MRAEPCQMKRSSDREGARPASGPIGHHKGCMGEMQTGRPETLSNACLAA